MSNQQYPNGPTANFRQIFELKHLQADMSTSYDGNRGAERTFIRDSEIDQKDIKRDSEKHVIEGVSEYEYLESLGSNFTK